MEFDVLDWLEALILGVVQGFTEFLPVSSDGHLAITQRLFAFATGVSHTAADEVFFDVMLHVGTLTAIVLYYRSVWVPALKGVLAHSHVAGTTHSHPFVIRVVRLILEQSKSLLFPVAPLRRPTRRRSTPCSTRALLSAPACSPSSRQSRSYPMRSFSRR